MIDYDDAKKDAIYRFVNTQSHMTGKGFDPSLISETQNNVGHILDMINTLSPKHYQILIDAAKKE